MQARHLQLGAEGEAHAEAHLRRRGYRIVDRNVRAGGVEIDLIVRRGPLLVFVEVKTRRSRAQGSPELAVDARKQARLLRGASAWLNAQTRRETRIRFDVVACEVGASGEFHIRHLEDAFDAGP